MANNISNSIELISRSLDWIKRYRPEQYEQKFMQLVPLRSSLRNVLEAEQDNPAIAAYGESQKGKSYLMGNLLQKKGAPFMVKAEGREYNFVQSINPIGDKREATGVVTRFTAYNKHPEFSSEVYPARMKVFSITSIATILADGYFNDIINRESYSDEELKQISEDIYNKYSKKEDVQSFLIEDDIFEIRSYLEKFVKANTQFLWKSDFFEKVALVIRKIPEQNWIDVMSILWHNTPEINELFVKLASSLKKMNYVKYVYLPVEAVLHHGDNKNTVMSVDCLNGLYKSGDKISYTDVYVLKSDGTYQCLKNFDKSEISALCCEVAYNVDPEYLDYVESFYFDKANDGQPGYMSSSSYQKLSGGEITKKKLFEHSDLLDFPGAKNRESLKLEFLTNFDPETDQANMVKLFLRGKVSYLFNHYSDAKLINILMICHDSEDNKVTTMYNTINEWVNSYVGKSSSERAATLKLTGGISPLFVVGTKFNIDMTQKNNADGNSETALISRWAGRFSKVLYQNCFQAGDVDWFRNWTSEGSRFNNTYILRDYKYSACDGEGNNLFKGFSVKDKDPHESSLELQPEFYNLLKRTFVENVEHVGRFFEDRQLAWDVAATINNDGSLYIIKRLIDVSMKMDALRDEQFSRNVKEAMNAAAKIMSGYYIDTNADNIIPSKVKKAKATHREFDFACTDDNYFFGNLIHGMQLEYQETFKVVHEIIQSHELTAEVAAWDEFELIKKHLINCQTEEEGWQKLIDMYGFSDKEEATDFLLRKNINPSDLIPGAKFKKRTNSYIIAGKVMDYWKEKLLSSSFMVKAMSGTEFDTNVMTDLLHNTIEVSENFNIVNLMSEAIAPYVNVTAVHMANEYLVTDLVVNIINSFVTDFGFEFRQPEDISNCKNIAENYSLPVFRYLGQERKTNYTEEELTALFVDLNDDSEVVTPAFNMNYNLWLEYMYISFVGGGENVPKIENIQANNEVAEIISSINAI